MPVAEREISEEHSLLNPPVIPAFFNIQRRAGRLSGPITQTGWEGFKITQDEDGRYKLKRTSEFTLHILADGYCEIPDTKANRAKLERLCQEQIHHKVKMEKHTTDDMREVELPVKDADGRLVYTEEIERKEPAQFRRAKGRRSFDAKNDSTVDLVRPWLRQFVNVPDAILEPEHIED